MKFPRLRGATSLAPLLAALLLLIAGLVLLAVSGSTGNSGTSDDILEAVSETESADADARTRYDASPASEGVEADRASAEQPSRSRQNTKPKPEAAPFEFDLPVLELGIIQPGTIHTHVIGMTNPTDERLTLKRIHTGCVCTNAHIEGGDTVFEPGETVNLVIDTEAGYQLISKSVSVNIAVNEYQGAARFVTRFKVNNVVAARPSFVNARDRRTGQITLRSIDSRPFEVLSVNGEPPVFPASELYDPETDEPRRMYTIEWDLSEYEIPPRLLVIETDHPESRIFALHVYNDKIARRERQYFRGTMGGQQDTANLGYITPGESRELTVLYTYMPEPDDARATLADHDDVSVEIHETIPGETESDTYARFRFDFADDLEPGVLLRPVNVESGDASRRLWLYGIVKGEEAQN